MQPFNQLIFKEFMSLHNLVIFVNIQPITNKILELEALTSDGDFNDISMICICEHWLSPEQMVSLRLTDFELYNC